MNRALILLSLSAVALVGCSGTAKTADGQATGSAAAAGPAKPNPWSSDGVGPAAADAAVKPAAAKVAAKDPAAPTNPWAKDPLPGSRPSPAPLAKGGAKPK
jgi:hypothetical protein